MTTAELEKTAKMMVAEGKGILAIDESTPTIKKRFDSINVESTEENRRAYRDLLITNPDGNKYISGMILYDETIRQSTSDGIPFAKKLTNDGIMPGIKVDTGAKDFALHSNEKITEGLDGLRERLAEYKNLGAKFAKWRAVITIGKDIPTTACIDANTHALARYAGLCQEAGIVPMVEPEVLMDADNTIDLCYDITEKTLSSLFSTLKLTRSSYVSESSFRSSSSNSSGSGSSNSPVTVRVTAERIRVKSCSLSTTSATESIGSLLSIVSISSGSA